MNSLYADRVQTYGRCWHRPWSMLIAMLLVAPVGSWTMAQLTGPIPIVVCSQQEGNRYRAAVDVDGLVWTADLDTALACGHEKGRRVFLAIEAVTDCNCLINKQTVLRDYTVRQELRPYVLVTLSIDAVPGEFYCQPAGLEQQIADGQANLKFLEQQLDRRQEPLYAVLQPTGKASFSVVGVYQEARINNRAAFIDFLRNPSSDAAPPEPPGWFWEKLTRPVRDRL